ncbi:MAG TPA: hypothetical protein VFW86_03680, partial [Candidatus Limnocylindrales bacterium]|nr:hypothetical protein [Candidatus Limnocylindrales bacterium]
MGEGAAGRLKVGVVLPTMPESASPQGILAAAQTAERAGWSTAWVTDHVLVGGGERGSRYHSIHEALT